MYTPTQLDKVAKSQYADRLHDAELARLTQHNRSSHPGIKVAQLALVISGFAAVLIYVF